MIRAVLWPFRVLLRLSKIALVGFFVAALLLNIAVSALGFAALTSMKVFDAISGIVEVATSGRSVRGNHKQEVAAQRTRASTAERHARQARINSAHLRQDLRAERARSRGLDAQLRTANVERDRLARQAEAKRVTYRGQRRNAQDAVQDASRRVSSRLTRATMTNVGSVFAEAIPFAGVAVVVSATAYEVYEACAILGELQELASAFSPDDAPLDNQVCGITVPTSDVIMERVTSSPTAIWDQARTYYNELPDAASLLVLPRSTYDWFWTWFDSEP